MPHSKAASARAATNPQPQRWGGVPQQRVPRQPEPAHREYCAREADTGRRLGITRAALTSHSMGRCTEQRSRELQFLELYAAQTAKGAQVCAACAPAVGSCDGFDLARILSS